MVKLHEQSCPIKRLGAEVNSLKSLDKYLFMWFLLSSVWRDWVLVPSDLHVPAQWHLPPGIPYWSPTQLVQVYTKSNYFMDIKELAPHRTPEVTVYGAETKVQHVEALCYEQPEWKFIWLCLLICHFLRGHFISPVLNPAIKGILPPHYSNHNLPCTIVDSRCVNLVKTVSSVKAGYHPSCMDLLTLSDSINTDGSQEMRQWWRPAWTSISHSLGAQCLVHRRTSIQLNWLIEPAALALKQADMYALWPNFWLKGLRMSPKVNSDRTSSLHVANNGRTSSHCLLPPQKEDSGSIGN